MKKEKSTEELLIEQLIKDNNLRTTKDISSMFDNMYGKIVQTLLNEEMNEFMGYDKNSHVDKIITNRRNGSTSKKKKVKTDKGYIVIEPPRDRKGEFEPQIVKKRQKVLEGFDDIVISMYAKGLSLTDISEMVEKLYKIKLSRETLSNMTDSVNEEVTEWQDRKLQKCYPFVYVDCIYCYVKKNFISVKTAIYVMIGIDLEGKKEVIGIWNDDTESATFWQNILEEIKERGVEDILFISLDGLKGLSEAIERVYPSTFTQRCIVHIVRNIYSILDKKKAKQIIQDFKKIYTSSNKIKAKLAYEEFVTKYNDNVKLIKKVNEYIEHIYMLFEYPEEIRKIIYTTNPIESVNSALRKVTKGKGTFISEQALIKVLYLRIKDLETKWSKGTKGWNTVKIQLIELFGNRILKYYE